MVFYFVSKNYVNVCYKKPKDYNLDLKQLCHGADGARNVVSNYKIVEGHTTIACIKNLSMLLKGNSGVFTSFVPNGAKTAQGNWNANNKKRTKCAK